ncbi:MAG: class I SAM-dependent methyltransferase [Syntrophobacteraceae bacterium]
MNEVFNADEYWKSRHRDPSYERNISSVGLKSFSNRANYFIYKIVMDQYGKVLSRLKLEKNTRFLDAGAGIGMFSQFLREKGFDVTALDVSPVALDKISNPEVKKIVGSLSETVFPPDSFDVVHCFDVLYHIIEDQLWESAIAGLCDCSRRYVVLHERFLRFDQIIPSKHIKMRPYRKTLKILNKRGFFEIMSIPTHMVALRLPTYRLAQFAPEFFYLLDRHFLNRFDDTSLGLLGSHHIKVFERRNSSAQPASPFSSPGVTNFVNNSEKMSNSEESDDPNQ